MREEGYYWVKYQNEWIIAEWAKLSKYCWFRTGYNDVLPIRLISEIDERRITREEYIIKPQEAYDNNDSNLISTKIKGEGFKK